MNIHPDAIALKRDYACTPARLFPLCHWKALDKAGKPLGKTPSVKDWTKEAFDFAAMIARAEDGKNVGFRLGDGIGVVDYDPRRDQAGDTLKRLCADFGIDLAKCFVVETGGGGVHAYMRLPADWRGREQDSRYPGIEWKHGSRRYVVAAGSIHPNGKRYVVRNGSAPLDQTAEVPAALLEAYQHNAPPLNERGQGPESFGNFTPDQLAATLAHIPVENFRSGADPSWEQFMMSCHWMTGGTGREEFVEWSISDPLYSTFEEDVRKRWDSCTPRADGIKTGLIFKTLERLNVPREHWPTEGASVLFDAADFEGIEEDPSDKPPKAAEPAPTRKVIEASQYVWRDPADIPARDFLYGHTLLRGAVTVTLGHGGGGKTALTIAEDLALITGRALLDIQPKHLEGVKVWAINLEDDRDELARRFAAAATFYGIGPDKGESQPDWASRLSVNGSETELCIATTTRDGTTISVPDVEAVKANIRRHGFDVITVDPFVSSHRVSENDNGAIDLVVKQWAKIASECRVAVQLVHHSRKTNGGSVTDEDARGAVALKAGARIMRQVNAMTDKQAEEAGIADEDRFDYFHVSQGKRNMSRRDGGHEWYKFVSVALPNGDEVGVVTPFTFASRKLTTDQLERVRRALEDGQARYNPQATTYFGKAVAYALDMDLKRVKPLIDRWVSDGALIVVERQDEHRKLRQFVQIGDWSLAVPPDQLSTAELQALDEVEAFRATHGGLL